MNECLPVLQNHNHYLSQVAEKAKAVAAKAKPIVSHYWSAIIEP